jgi:alkylation response protein AidB-like acyl-CoA dehydrogenase
MDFRYNEEQLALKETLRRFIARDYGFQRRRELARSPLGYSAEAWAQYADLGLLALPLPAQYGGLDGNGTDVMAVMEEFGAGLLLEPYVSTVVLCGGLIRDYGSQAQRETLLPRIAAGQAQLALASLEGPGRYEPSYVAAEAVREEGGWRLCARKSVVIDAPSADFFVVSARTGGDVCAAAGITLFLVPRTTPGLSLLSYATQSGGRAADLELVDVRVDDAAVIGTPGEALGLLRRGADLAAAALCAEAVGIVTALNQATLAYLKSRKQFGVPIGVFQALQHRMADMYIAEEQIRSMAILAAVQVDAAEVAARQRAICAAKAYIGRAARFVGQQAVQLHGAMGMVDDLIISHYFKRLTMIDITFGDSDFHFARFSDSLVNPAAAASVPAPQDGAR